MCSLDDLILRRSRNLGYELTPQRRRSGELATSLVVWPNYPDGQRSLMLLLWVKALAFMGGGGAVPTWLPSSGSIQHALGQLFDRDLRRDR